MLVSQPEVHEHFRKRHYEEYGVCFVLRLTVIGYRRSGPSDCAELQWVNQSEKR